MGDPMSRTGHGYTDVLRHFTRTPELNAIPVPQALVRMELLSADPKSNGNRSSRAHGRRPDPHL